MLSNENLLELRSQLQRIFTMKVSRSSYREIQNLVISITKSNKVLANQLLLTLLSGELQPEVVRDTDTKTLETICSDFSSQVRLAKEIQEKGDFINIITSDLLGAMENSSYLNRVKRIDGEEFHFVTDLDSTIKMVHHFLNRLAEFKQNPSNKEVLEKQRASLKIALAALEHLLEKDKLST